MPVRAGLGLFFDFKQPSTVHIYEKLNTNNISTQIRVAVRKKS
jgi:hypothetical protein